MERQDMSKKDEKYFCEDCGKEILFCDIFESTYDSRCVDCYIKNKEK